MKFTHTRQMMLDAVNNETNLYTVIGSCKESEEFLSNLLDGIANGSGQLTKDELFTIVGEESLQSLKDMWAGLSHDLNNQATILLIERHPEFMVNMSLAMMRKLLLLNSKFEKRFNVAAGPDMQERLQKSLLDMQAVMGEFTKEIGVPDSQAAIQTCATVNPAAFEKFIALFMPKLEELKTYLITVDDQTHQLQDVTIQPVDVDELAENGIEIAKNAQVVRDVVEKLQHTDEADTAILALAPSVN